MSKTDRTLRSVALFEAAKGLLVLLAGWELFAYIHRDLQTAAQKLVGHLHLNLAKHNPGVFIDALLHWTDTHLWLLVTAAASYVVLRFVEAYGLWRGRRWAEWLAAVSAGIYVPFEVYELARDGGALAVGALLVNLLVVACMVRALRQGRRVEAGAHVADQ